ncbi:MAG: murein hydrolase activator EnvC family protein [Candidatus Saccharibacteria bacterium]
MSFKRCIAILLTAIFLTLNVMPVGASELEDKQKQLKAIEAKIAAQRALISRTKKQEKGVLKELRRLEKEVDKTQSEIKSLTNKENQVQTHIELTTKDITKSETNLAKRTRILKSRLVRVYQAGDVSYLEVLLSSTSFTDLLTRWDYLNEIFRQDRNLINTITTERNTLKKKKEDLQTTKQNLQNIKSQKKEKQQELEQKSEEKQETLESIEKQRRLYEKALRELEEDSQQIEKIIQRLQSSSGKALGTGHMGWPCPGRYSITSDYGMRFHPILHQYRMHTGVDIGAPYGAKIVAADSGTVIYRGYMGGYGNVIIIDHGKGTSTLYAHQSSFSVGNGANVVKGQQIGRVGSTGWSTGPHLHFEVRRNGTPVNPHGYI